MQRIFDSIPSVVRGLGPDGRTDAALVFGAWSLAAGEGIRERTAPIGFDSGRLTVAVSDVTWQRQLTALASSVLAQLNRLLGPKSVNYIEFVVDRAAVTLSVPVDIAADDIPNVPPALEAAARSIADDELRRSFLAFAASRTAAVQDVGQAD